MTDSELAVRVTLGAEFLDRLGPPDWREKINLYALDMADADKCILGQIYGQYDTGYQALGLTVYQERVDYGFTAQHDDMGELTDAWREYLGGGAVEHSADPDEADVDDFIEEWGAKLEKMYTNRTAGDYSFTGFVVALMRDMGAKGVQPF